MFSRNWFGWLTTCTAFLGLVGPAWASALPASYTLTDLGPFGGRNLKVIANDQGIVQSADGTTYAFPRTTTTASASDLAAVASPLPKQPNSFTAFSQVEYGVVNAQGLLFGSAAAGRGGSSINGMESATFVAQRQADGSFGPARVLWSAAGSSHSGFAMGASIADMNASGVALGMTQELGRTFLLADSATGQVLTLPSTLDRWMLDAPIAIDDRGRLLFAGDSLDTPDEHLLLLTPDGVSSDPIATPEPSTLAILSIAGAGWLVRRRQARRPA